MSASRDQLRILGPTALTSLLLLVVCGAASAYLYRQQSHTAAELGENLGSRRAAANLEETLRDLADLHRAGTDRVGPLHQRVDALLGEIESYADKPEEKTLADQLIGDYHRYLARWNSSTGAARSAAARAAVEDEMLPACLQLRNFNAAQIEASEVAHRQTPRRMAWGLAGVSAVGALAGPVLGYGVAGAAERYSHCFGCRPQPLRSRPCWSRRHRCRRPSGSARTPNRPPRYPPWGQPISGPRMATVSAATRPQPRGGSPGGCTATQSGSVPREREGWGDFTGVHVQSSPCPSPSRGKDRPPAPVAVR